MSLSIRISIAMLFAMQAVPRAVTVENTYEGKSLAEWRTQTQPQFAYISRHDAIWALASIAEKATSPVPPRPENIAWVEAEIVPTMIELFHDKDPAVRRKALEYFGRFPKAGRSAVQPLIKLLDDQDDFIRALAARNLIAIEPTETVRLIPVLGDLVHKSNAGAVQGYAAGQLARIKPEGPKVLIALLSDKDPAVRAVAINNLREYCATTGLGLPVLRQLLLDDVARVRMNAVSVISQMRPPTQEAVSAIMPLLQDKDAGVRATALRSLIVMHADPTQILPEIVKLVNDESDADSHLVRRQLADSLGRMGPAAIPALIKLLDDKDAHVRARATDSLGQIGPAAEEAVPALKHLLTDMSRVYYGDIGVRVCHHAGKALARILGDKSYLEGLPALPPDGK